MNRLDKLRRRAVFQEDSRGPGLKSAERARVVHPRGHHQDADAGMPGLHFFEKRRTLFVAEIVIEQNDVDVLARDGVERFG